MRVQARHEQAELRCAYCHGRQDGAMQTCPGCGTRLHVGCQRELGACSTLGCVRGQQAVRGVPAPEHGSPLWACAGAALLGKGLAEIQELLLTRHTHTPSDVVALVALALLVTAALGIWLARGGWAGGGAPTIASAAYLCAGLSGADAVVHRGLWFVAGGLVLAALVAQRFASPRPTPAR